MWKTFKDSLFFPKHIPRRFTISSRHCSTMFSRLKTREKGLNCKALVRRVLNKLPGIKAELIQGKPEWKTWDFTQLVNALREHKEIHPREIAKSHDRCLCVDDHDPNAPQGCVVCKNTSRLVIVQLSQARPIGRNFYKRRRFVLIALSLIEQLAVEAEETALDVSKGITYRSTISLPNLLTRELK